jgi:hypothetical protein
MRSICGRLALAASTAMFAPHLAAGDEVQEQLQLMNERISQLEQQLQATDDELQATSARATSQQELLERAGLGPDAEPRSALSRFLTETEFDGWVAASYWYNANNPATGRDGNIGNPRLGFDTDGLSYRRHPDHNSFQVDQVWFKMSNAATPESRGGFGVDLVFGKTADTLRSDRSEGNLSSVYQAYVDYLAPLGPGIQFRLGRFASAIGAEQIETVYNFNVSRSNLHDLLQPKNHVGVTASSKIGPAAQPQHRHQRRQDAALGRRNRRDRHHRDRRERPVGRRCKPSAPSPCVPSDPPGVSPGHRSHHGETHRDRRSRDPLGPLRHPRCLDRLRVPVDTGCRGRSGRRGPVPKHPRRPQITERTAISVRAEGIIAKDNYLDPLMLGGDGDQTLWSVTGTLDHSFTEQLVVRLEARYDQGESPGSDDIFFQDGDLGPDRRDQFVGGVEAYYRF